MKYLNFQSLYMRIFAIFWLTLLLVLIAVLLAQNSDPRQVRDLPEARAKYHEKLIKKIQNDVDASESLAEGLESIIKKQDRKSRLRLYFTSLSGDLFFKDYPNLRILQNFVSVVSEPENPKEKSYGRWLISGPFLIKKDHEKALLYVGIPNHQPLPFYIQILDRPFYLLLVTMLVSTPLLLWLAWMLTRPARNLQSAAEKIIKGHFDTDARLEKGPSEFKKAGASFNQMVNSINQMINEQQRLLSDISHELRSPLTRLRMANALAARKQGESAELIRINTEAERMELMINDLLSLSRMQINSQMERDFHLISTLWKPLLEDAEFEAMQNNKKLIYSALPNIKIEGNAGLLYSALENVVRNAIKYAAQLVQIEIKYEFTGIVIIVSDDGPGVPKENLDDIFRPFYRVSSARDRETGGTGLGLAITYNAMLEHNGSAHAKLNARGGLTVVLTFNLS